MLFGQILSEKDANRYNKSIFQFQSKDGYVITFHISKKTNRTMVGLTRRVEHGTETIFDGHIVGHLDLNKLDKIVLELFNPVLNNQDSLIVELA